MNFKKFTNRFALIAIVLVAGFYTYPCIGQVSYTGGSYAENFDSFLAPVPGNNTVQSTPVLPTGWLFVETGSGANLTYRVHNGGGNTGDTYVFGATSSAERAIGGVASGSLTSQWGIYIVNNTGYTLSEFTVTYKGEQWRDGGSPTSVPNTIGFSYSIGATSLTSGTYLNVNQLDFVAPVNNLTADVILDGNLAVNQVNKTHTITGISWTNGTSLYLRWSDINETGNDDGMGIDDFSFSAQGTPPAPTTQDFNITFPTVLPNAITANWTNGDGSSRIVIVNTSNSFTNPTNGISPSANSVYGGTGEQVVYNGNGSSVNVTSLNPSTQYFFRVYAYNGSGIYASYNINGATDNPKDQTTQPAATPLITVTGSLSNFGDVLLGNSSAEQTYTVEGSNLSNDISISAPVGFEISLTPGSGFTNLITLTQVGGAVGTTTIYARFTPVALGAASGNISHSSAGATTFNQPVAGTGVEPVININVSSFTFNNIFVGGNSANQTYTVNGSNLQSNITVTTTPDFEISTSSGSGFGSSVTLNATGLGNPGGGSVSNTIIYVRFSPLAPGTQNASVDNVSTNAVTQSISLTGTAVLPPTFTELVVPKYMGSKSASGINNCRTPIAICIQLDNLQPFTSYDVKLGFGLTSDAATSYGAGNFWNGSSYNSTPNILGAFFTDATGSSGPVWLYMQPTGNTTRFDAGQIHNVRFGYAISGNSMPASPQFVGAKTITCLDIPTTARTSGITTDDGAFLHVQSTACNNGKYILIYDNVAGTGDPLFSYQARNAVATNTTQSDLPSTINSIYLQSGSSVAGDFAAVIPIGANNPNGVQRIEARNADNTVYKFTTDADGIWNSGANTTTNTRRSVTTIAPTDGLNDASGSISGDTAVCAGSPVNLYFTFTGTPPFAYLFTDGTNNYGPYFSLTNTDVKSVTPLVSSSFTLASVDDAQCTGTVSGSAFIFVSNGAPSASVVVPITGLPANACNGTTVSISVPFVTGATQYIWDGPSGCYFNGNPLNVSPYITSTPSVSLTFGNPNGSGYYIGVQAANLCGSSLRKVQWVRGVVSSPVISGPSTICALGSEAYAINPVVGAVNYTWTGPAGSTIDGNPSPYTTTSTFVTLTTPSGFTTGSMCVTANTSCYNTPPKCISISKTPLIPGVMSGVFTVCPNTTQTYSVPQGGVGGTYSWTLPANATGSSTTNSINVSFNTGFTGGNLSVVYTNACGEVSPTRTKSISIGSPATPASITGITNGICGQTINYSCPSQAGVTSFNWTLPAGATGSSTSNAISVTFPGSGFTTGALSVSATNVCGTSLLRSITVKGAPNTPGVITPTPAAWCNNDASISLSADISGVTGSYLLNWNIIPAAVAIIVSGQGTSNLLVDWNTGNAAVNLTASNGCGSATRNYSAMVSCRSSQINKVENLEQGFEMYPNPATGVVMFKLSELNENIMSIKFRDITGRLVLQHSYDSPTNSKEVSVYINQLKAGTYITEVITSHKSYNAKLVVEK